MDTEVVEKTQTAILNINVSRIIVGLTEVGNLEIEDFDTNYNISKTITNLSAVEKAYAKSLQAIMKKYIKLDAKGDFEVSNNNYVFNSDEDKKAYSEAYEKLGESVVEAKVWTLKASELKKIKGIKGTTMAKCFELIVNDLQ